MGFKQKQTVSQQKSVSNTFNQTKYTDWLIYMYLVSLFIVMFHLLFLSSCRRQITGEEDKNKLYTNEISLSKIEHETTYTGIQFTDDNPAYQYESLSRQNEATYTNTIPWGIFEIQCTCTLNIKLCYIYVIFLSLLQ